MAKNNNLAQALVLIIVINLMDHQFGIVASFHNRLTDTAEVQSVLCRSLIVPH